jgi:type II secretion system protein G
MRKEKGFTLIELLLVILIIIGLAAIVVPNYMNVSDESKTAADAANKDALKAAVRLMVLDVGLKKMPGANLAAVATNPNLVSVGGTYKHGPYVEIIPVASPITGANYSVTINTTSGAITITP